jgi:ribosomal protein L11 methyltransferase
MSSANYKQFTIQSSPFIPELLSSLLWELEILGITEEENSLKVFVDEKSFVDKSSITTQLNNLVDQKMIEEFYIVEEIIPLKNWNEEWEKSREVIRVSNRIVIKPTFKNYSPAKDEIVLTIDPKMSFGTGEHQTTKLVLKFLEKIVKKNDRVLDVGSGTGILSIASIKLGAGSAIAVDNDELCFDNCNENCELNEVVDKVKILCGEISNVTENDFDMVIANIQKNVLIDIAGQIKSKLKKDGIVILSGLLKIDEADIVDHYSSLGFVKVESESMDEWIALVLMERR